MKRPRSTPERGRGKPSRRAVAPATPHEPSPTSTTKAAVGRSLPTVLLIALVLASAVTMYMPALDTSFFADDYLFLDQVRQKPLLAALRTPDPLSNFYRPVSRQLYFWTVAGSSNESARAFHVVGLLWFAVLLLLLFGLARRLAGTYGATFAVALVALHYTADVPIRWACGSQELLSVSGALATLWLHLR